MKSITKLFINSLVLLCMFEIHPTSAGTVGDAVGCTATPGCISKGDKDCSTNILYTEPVQSLLIFDCCCSIGYNAPSTQTVSTFLNAFNPFTKRIILI